MILVNIEPNNGNSKAKPWSVFAKILQQFFVLKGFYGINFGKNIIKDPS